MAVHKRCGSGYFNPRSREGSDWRDQKWWNYVIISIRAPAKGATGDSLINALSGDISIRAPAKGATNARAYDRLH